MERNGEIMKTVSKQKKILIKEEQQNAIKVD